MNSMKLIHSNKNMQLINISKWFRSLCKNKEEITQLLVSYIIKGIKLINSHKRSLSLIQKTQCPVLKTNNQPKKRWFIQIFKLTTQTLEMMINKSLILHLCKQTKIDLLILKMKWLLFLECHLPRTKVKIVITKKIVLLATL